MIPTPGMVAGDMNGMMVPGMGLAPGVPGMPTIFGTGHLCHVLAATASGAPNAAACADAATAHSASSSGYVYKGAAQSAVTTAADTHFVAATVASEKQTPATGPDGKARARDFSFLVTEDKQEAGPNLAMLDDSADSDSDCDSDSDSNSAAGIQEAGFEAGSAIDQLLYRQKAVSGMETRRPGESADAFFKRKIAGMRMLNAAAGTSEAKGFENEVEIAIMNSKTAWNWGAGDHDADFASEDEPIMMLDAHDSAAGPLQLNMKPGGPDVNIDSGAAATLGSGGTLVACDAAAGKRRGRLIVGSEGIRDIGKLVPKADKGHLSNSKLQPVDSGRGLALLEKMGWKKGQGLGREGTGQVLPVEAFVKGDMGGLRVDGEETVRGKVHEFSADGPELSESGWEMAAATPSTMLAASNPASMASEFSLLTSQTKSVQQINEENRRAAIGLGSAPGAAALPPTTLPAPPSVPPQQRHSLQQQHLPQCQQPPLPVPPRPLPPCAAWGQPAPPVLVQTPAQPGYGHPAGHQVYTQMAGYAAPPPAFGQYPSYTPQPAYPPAYGPYAGYPPR